MPHQGFRGGRRRLIPIRRHLATLVVTVAAVGVGVLAPQSTSVASAAAPTTWSVAPSPNYPGVGFLSQLDSVSCVGSAFCMAVGSAVNDGFIQTLGEEWNGSSWSLVTTPNPPSDNAADLQSVSCVSASYCVAVGYAGTTEGTASPLIEVWNGSTWSIYPAMLPLPPGGLWGQLYGVSCVSTSFCTAVGTWETGAQVPTAYAVTSNGGTWSLSGALAEGNSQVLGSVSCTSVSSCTAVGYLNGPSASPFAEQFDGSSWTVTLDSFYNPANGWNGGELSSVSCAVAKGCMAVGFYHGSSANGAYGQWWNGTTWTPMYVRGLSALQFSSLASVSCEPAVGCSAAGQIGNSRLVQNLVANWTSSSGFSQVTTPSPNANESNEASGISCVTYIACIVVGTNNPGKSQSTMALTGPVLSIGFWLVGTDGGLFSFGDANFFGSLPGVGDFADTDIVGMAPAGNDLGYWMVGADGGVFAFGEAKWAGSVPSLTLHIHNIVAMVPSYDAGGYWLGAANGGIFAFGDANFYGSAGNLTLNAPIVGMALTPDQHGYWLVASDGGIFSYGDARFYGSAGSLRLNQPIVGMAATPDGRGYWLVAADGGIFSYGDAQFYGSAGAGTTTAPVVGIMPTSDGGGYWTVASDGGVSEFGDAPNIGTLWGTVISSPIVGGAPS
jgi:hypothetical protein